MTGVCPEDPRSVPPSASVASAETANADRAVAAMMLFEAHDGSLSPRLGAGQ